MCNIIPDVYVIFVMSLYLHRGYCSAQAETQPMPPLQRNVPSGAKQFPDANTRKSDPSPHTERAARLRRILNQDVGRPVVQVKRTDGATVWAVGQPEESRTPTPSPTKRRKTAADTPSRVDQWDLSHSLEGLDLGHMDDDVFQIPEVPRLPSEKVRLAHLS